MGDLWLAEIGKLIMGSFECTLSFIIDAKDKFVIMYPV